MRNSQVRIGALSLRFSGIRASGPYQNTAALVGAQKIAVGRAAFLERSAAKADILAVGRCRCAFEKTGGSSEGQGQFVIALARDLVVGVDGYWIGEWIVQVAAGETDGART